MKSKKALSYFMFLSAMLIFGTIGIFRRFIPIPSNLLASIRGFLGALVLFIYSVIKKENKEKFDKKTLLLLILTGAIMGFNWIALFEAYNYTSIATATLCYYMEPTIIILLSPIVLKENLNLKKIICAIVAIVGMVFVSGIFDNFSFEFSEIKGVIYGIVSAILYASVIMLNKRITVGSPSKKTTIQLLTAGIVTLPYALLTTKFDTLTIDTKSVFLILLVGIVHSGFAYLWYFSSLQMLKGQSIAILSYIDPIAALILSAIILGEKMTALGIVGAVLIIGSAIVSEINISIFRNIK